MHQIPLTLYPAGSVTICKFLYFFDRDHVKITFYAVFQARSGHGKLKGFLGGEASAMAEWARS
ncbi:hypothetical protein FACS189468_6920 [Spirochaetia bacterium]|nr:hypothetical protein FACS189468_6920 [Spirochaetia bacterium]